MHVLILPSWYPTDSLPVQGIFCQDQAQALSRVGVKVGVVYPDLSSIRNFSFAQLKGRHFQTVFVEEVGVTTLRLHGWEIPFTRGRFKVNQTLRLVDSYVCKFGKPDLIHAQCTLWAGVAAMVAAKRYGVPFLITEHSSAFLRQRIKPWQVKRLRAALYGANRVLAVSRVLAEQMIRQVGDPGLHVEVVPNMINTDFFMHPPKPRRSRPFRILSVALLTPNKGMDILLRAFAQGFGSLQDVFLEIGGDGPHREELMELASCLGVGHRVRFSGMLSRDQVREAMWNANLFVCSSYKETFGLVLLEAIATGLPIVTTKCGGPEEFVQSCNGLLTNPGDINGLEAAMLKVFNDYEYYTECSGGKPDSQTALRFSRAVVLDKLLMQYREVLQPNMA